jgi:hypothetical protein
MKVFRFTSVRQIESKGVRSDARLLACSVGLAVALLGCVFAQAASAEPPPSTGFGTSTGLAVSAEPEVSLTPSTTKPYTLCPPGGRMIECNIVVDPPPVETLAGFALPDGGPLFEGSGEKGGYAPTDLQSAYKIPTSGGSGETVALVEAYGYASAEGDLGTYRAKYGLEACTKASGCFKKVNEKGEEGNYPAEGNKLEKEWSLETSLDMDMVSSACPNCKILLVEATTQDPTDTAASVEEAAKLKAGEISNSYGYLENEETWCPSKNGCKEYLSDYDHPGIPVTVSAGDSGYDNHRGAPNWPATSPNVIAVGGTNLKKAETSRGWSETVWIDTGSGCSLYESKPTWQTDKGCNKRTDNDIAAVASPSTPVSAYNTPYAEGWINLAGTSASAPLVAGIEAHASTATKKLGAQVFYKNPGMLFHVSEGSNGGCGTEAEPTWYLCHATKEGYNGPTGEGTPDGVFTSGAVPTVTTGSATNITETGATLHGTVSPEGSETKYYFEYGAEKKEYAKWAKTAEASAGSGTNDVEESAAITGLTPNKAYYFRLAATSSGGTTYGAEEVLSTGWSLQETLNVNGATKNELAGVSCASSTECIAVGQDHGSSGDSILVQSWTSTEWKNQEPPRPTGATESSLDGISCTSSSACTAVGWYENSSGTKLSLAERWNGTEWKLQETPNPTGSTATDLLGVSCTSATECIAVGYYTKGGTKDLAERWNGTEWKLQEPPEPSGTEYSWLVAVSCTSSGECVAVGRSHETNYKGFAEQWDGTEWKVQETPTPTGSRENYLEGVSCTSSSACTATGTYWSNTAKTLLTLTERWNGTEWKIQETPNPATYEDQLSEVSCTTATECVAVGKQLKKQSEAVVTLAERWNGAEWKVQETPNPPKETSLALSDVSCPSAMACMAVGFYESAETRLTLAELYQ